MQIIQITILSLETRALTYPREPSLVLSRVYFKYLKYRLMTQNYQFASLEQFLEPLIKVAKFYINTRFKLFDIFLIHRKQIRCIEPVFPKFSSRF